MNFNRRDCWEIEHIDCISEFKKLGKLDTHTHTHTLWSLTGKPHSLTEANKFYSSYCSCFFAD